MGGDSIPLSSSSTEDEVLIGKDFPYESIKPPFLSGNDDEGLNATANLENDDSMINDESRFLKLREDPDVGAMISPIAKAKERQRLKVYEDVLKSYQELQSRIQRLEEAKSKLLCYTPGLWIEKAVGKSSRTYDLPNATTLLLIGPKGSGKSSLINKISRAFEDDLFVPGRAQVSNTSSSGDGTSFLHEYMIPRDFGSFCLYDTRSLSDDFSENLEMIKHWMTKGVRHGEPVKRRSDSMDFKSRLNCKARQSRSSNRVRPVNFAIFVLSGLSALEAVDGSDEEKKKSFEMIATVFNDPLLSFRNDKPVIVVTHTDLLSLSDRVRIRVYLGELLGVPPAQQIFDIPENDSAETTLTIVDMLFHCLERADRNLPVADLCVYEEWAAEKWMYLVIIVLAMVLFRLLAHGFAVGRPRAPPPAAASTQVNVEWHKIRHLWMG